MGDWWAQLTTIEQIYWSIGIPATAIFLVFLVMSLVAGADTDIDLDSDVDLDIDAGFQFISLKSLLGFFTVFAWSGLACLESGMSNVSTILVSFISGLGMMTLVAAIFYFMSRVTDDGTLKMKNAINGIGEVYLTIPGKRVGFGKVQIRIQGRLHELEAATDEEKDIPTGRLVTVLEVVNDEVLIVKSNG